ncbi:TetR/AcrR family transcriptional regulator [Streptomyces sp. NPDC048288]|uniref:TetR/AcrR family transcriptional regulator n=1 Tax=Streptomyces sp. NPDC048288 TaxID=3365529 RepID=UPI00371FE6DA
MRETRTSSGRRRPAASHGPARDTARDARIIEAALDLLAQQGYPDLTMDDVAARAGVSKATVYRRWASRQDLVADALETLDFTASAGSDAAHSASLRDDLVRTLSDTSGCTDKRGPRLTAVLLATTRSDPDVTFDLRERYVDAQRTAVADCLRRATARGELDATRVEELLDPGRLEITAAIALMVHQPLFDQRPLNADDIAGIVDQVLLPLVAGARVTH